MVKIGQLMSLMYVRGRKPKMVSGFQTFRRNFFLFCCCYMCVIGNKKLESNIMMGNNHWSNICQLQQQNKCYNESTTNDVMSFVGIMVWRYSYQSGVPNLLWRPICAKTKIFLTWKFSHNYQDLFSIIALWVIIIMVCTLFIGNNASKLANQCLSRE